MITDNLSRFEKVLRPKNMMDHKESLKLIIDGYLTIDVTDCEKEVGRLFNILSMIVLQISKYNRRFVGMVKQSDLEKLTELFNLIHFHEFINITYASRLLFINHQYFP